MKSEIAQTNSFSSEKRSNSSFSRAQASSLDVKRSGARGITLIELLVVMVLIALVSSIVGGAMGSRFDTIALQTTATQLAAEFQKAQTVARVTQIPVAMTYSDRTFRFWKAGKAVAVYGLPSSITVGVQDLPTYVFLPSGQILGAGSLELQNERGRRIRITTESLTGIRVRFEAAL